MCEFLRRIQVSQPGCGIGFLQYAVGNVKTAACVVEQLEVHRKESAGGRRFESCPRFLKSKTVFSTPYGSTHRLMGVFLIYLLKKL